MVFRTSSSRPTTASMSLPAGGGGGSARTFAVMPGISGLPVPEPIDVSESVRRDDGSRRVGDVRPHRRAGDVGLLDAECVEETDGVVGHVRERVGERQGLARLARRSPRQPSRDGRGDPDGWSARHRDCRSGAHDTRAARVPRRARPATSSSGRRSPRSAGSSPDRSVRSSRRRWSCHSPRPCPRVRGRWPPEVATARRLVRPGAEGARSRQSGRPAGGSCAPGCS